MKILPFLLFACLACSRASAQEKGASPLPATATATATVTRAVIIGISDYQHPEIPDLRFAHRDAEVFAQFLRSTAGGGLDEDHLKILLNEQATMGNVAGAMDWLMTATSR